MNIVDSSALSPETSLIAATVPAKPGSVTLVSQSETAITFSWIPDADTGGTVLTQYKIKWSTNGAAYVDLDTNASAASTQYTVDSVNHSVQTGQSYSFKVISTNFVGDSSESDPLENIVAGTPPGVPQNL